MTDTLTDTTAQRAALVAYYDLKRASYQLEADQMDVKRASYQLEADKMDSMGRTVRILNDAHVADEYHDLVVGSSTGIPHGNAR